MPTNANRRQRLFHLLPDGLPVTKAWLHKQSPDLDRHAVDNLLKSGQFLSLAPGVYVRPGSRLTWQGVVASLQTIFRTDLTVGGLTALQLQGYAHYLPLAQTQRVVRLYGRDALPRWLDAALPGVTFERHTRLPGVGATGLKSNEYDTYSGALADVDIPDQNENGWPLTLSSPELAYLEVLMDVPDTVSFEHADQLLQGMTTLSPRRLEQILRKCTSVKVRRLFYWFAERHAHPWFKKLPAPKTLDDLGLGSGNRMLAKGGRLDPKYRITVPEEMWTLRAPTTDK
ncbi:MAG: type IV toxin-antitoxin system AbiEi family antitoxin domain-containing protein [Burkholderiales bacterium]